MSRILIANELPVCEEIKQMALTRLRRLLHRNRETSRPTLDGSGAAVNEESYRNLLSQQGFHAPYNLMMTEMVRDRIGNIQDVAQLGEGSVAIARNESNRPIHVGDMLVVGENGGVRPIEPDELMEYANSNRTLVASLEEVPEGTPQIRVRVQQGNLNLITGEPHHSIADAISRIGEVLQPIVNEVVQMTQPLAEMVDEIVNDLAEGAGIDRDHLIPGWNGGGHPRLNPNVPNKYDKKYPHLCWKCKQPLQYNHALGKAKEKGFTEEQHKKMWKSAIVEYYCCNCYSREERQNYHYTGIATPNPTAGIFALEHIRRAMNNVNARWHIGPAGRFEFIDQGHRCLRIIGENDEVLYQEEPRNVEPVFSTEYIPEPVHHETIGLHVRLIGGFSDDGERQYCNHSARRIVYTPLPDAHREIHFEENFPHVNDNEKLIAIAQIYTQWFMKARTINIEYIEFPLFIRSYIDRIINNPQHTITSYSDIVRACGIMIEEYFTQQDASTIADYRERVLWRGYHVGEPVRSNNQINQVRLYGGIVDGERLEVITGDPERQIEQGGVHTFVENHPEITSQEALNNLAQSILNRQPPGFLQEYHQNPINPDIATCRHHEFNERGECLACGINRVQIDMMRSTRLAEHHRMGTHNFEYINGEMLCSVCRLSTMEIDAQRNRNHNLGELIP